MRAARLALHRPALRGAWPRRSTAATRSGARVLDWPGDPAQPTRWRCACAAGCTLWSAAATAPGARRALSAGTACPTRHGCGEALAPTLVEQAEALDPWLDSAPQTNEVGRSAVLMSGLLVARRPVSASRCGCSSSAPAPGSTCSSTATATISADVAAGRGRVAVAAEAGLEGAAAARRAGRASPGARGSTSIRSIRVGDRERLLAYVWPDQPERLAPARGGARPSPPADPPPVEAGDAADWLEAKLAPSSRSRASAGW